MPKSIEAKTYVIKGVSYPEPEAIDLGLPSGNKWANMNIGASSVNEIGGYYGWADPTGELTYESYNWRNVDLDGAWNSPLFGGTNPPRDISGTELDIATNKLGSDWCMPSSDDFKELTDNCTFAVESEYVKVTGPNGNSIFLPISGMYIWSGRINNPVYGHSMTKYPCFWVSTRSFYNHNDSEYWTQYNQPAADYAHADADGFWGADGTCDSWYRNGMIPIRAIKRGKNDAGYVEVCGIKWAKGNLLYDAVNGGDQTFETNWKLAPEQWYYFNYADGFGQQTYDQWENQIDHFNFGVCGSNALSNSSNPTFNRLYDVAGKMYTDANCTQECSDFSKAQYGDIAFWASRGKYRMPTMAEFHKIGDEASISFGYCLSQDNKKVYGCLFTNPVGERIIDSNDKQFTKGDLDKGLFLPFNSTRLNPEATAGHNGKLIYYGNDGSYWSSEVVFDAMVAGTNERVNMPCGFIVQNFAGTDMDDGVHTLMTYFIGGRHQGQPIRPVLVNQNGEIVSNNNTLSCLDVQCLVGTTPTLNVVLQNDDEVKLCQFDLQLPTGVTVATKSNGKLNATLTTRAENHSISSQQLSNGNYRFIVSSMDNDSFTGNNGTLMEITLNVPTTMKAGEYTLKVLNAELSVPDGNDLKAIKLEDTESKLIVKDFTPGDVNNDGSVSVTDVGCAINYILEQVPSVFNFDAADMNGDKSVSVTDVGMIINLILNEGAGGSTEPESNDKTPEGVVAVDLGLPSGTLWANMNVGAKSMEDFGNYFAFGSTNPNVWGPSNYDYDDTTPFYVTSTYDEEMNEWFETYTVKPEYDAATVYWGSNWRIPSYEQLKELEDNCTVSFTTVNSVKGCKFTSKSNGKSIFLPAAGNIYYDDGIVLNEGWGCYSSDTWHSMTFVYNSKHFQDSYWNRAFGLSIRPICVNSSTSGFSRMRTEAKSTSDNIAFPPSIFLQPIAEGYELQLEDKDSFVGFQFDVELSDGIAIDGVQLHGASENDHLLTYRQLENGKWRVVCYSPTNSTFADDNTALLTIATAGDIIVSNIRLTTTGLEEFCSDDIVGTPTGIASMKQEMQISVQGGILRITSDRDTTLRLYTIDGSICRTLHVHRGVNSFDGLRAGIYMIDNKKVIVR